MVKKKRRRPVDVDDEEDEYEDPEEEEEDEDEDDRPKSKKGKKGKRSSDDDDDDDDVIKVKGGWEEYERQKKSAGGFPDRFEVTADPKLVKFRQDHPFAVYRQHWIDRPVDKSTGRRGRMSWTCAEDKCPLCEAGDTPRVLNLFNVVDMSSKKPKSMFLEAGVTLTGQIKNYNDSEKNGPIDGKKRYFAIHKVKTKNRTDYSLVPVKERDLEEDWERKPLSEERLAKLKLIKRKDAVPRATRSDLKKMAKFLSAEDYEDEE